VDHADPGADSGCERIDDGLLGGFAGVAETSLRFVGECDCSAYRDYFGDRLHPMVGNCGGGREYGDGIGGLYGGELLVFLCGVSVRGDKGNMERR